MVKATVLVPAAGTGSRMGGAVSKQYLELAGKPLLAHTLLQFENHPLVENIYLIVPAGDIPFCQQQIVARYCCNKVTRIVAGGTSRQDSVRNGLAAVALDGFDQQKRPILIHDGARPLFDCRHLEALITAVVNTGAATIGVPVKDTIKQVEDNIITASPERSKLWQVQTPQGFQYQLLQQAFTQAEADGFIGTDDASLVTRLGHAVQMLRGDYSNIKVTTPEDIPIALALMERVK